jgi:hypothetical protein
MKQGENETTCVRTKDSFQRKALRFAAFMIVVFAQNDVRHRVRELGVVIGKYPTGRYNAVTDVPGVLVGQTTMS